MELSRVAQMAAGSSYDDTKRAMMLDSIYKAMHRMDRRIVKVDELAGQLASAYSSDSASDS